MLRLPRAVQRRLVGALLVGLPLALALAVACAVPDLAELGAKACDPDAGHGCVAGYLCVEGVCRAPSGGACLEGASRSCGSDAGLCRPGVQRCDGGAWGACVGEIGPAAELCDGEDNDCDGAHDEDVTDTPLCTEQRGACAGARALCVRGAAEATCSAAAFGPLYEAAEASCDLTDNDCDGRVDRYADGGELRGGACELDAGVCAGATRACADGGFEARCGVASYGASYEPHELRCDGVDNDCDGLVDRGREVALVSSSNARTNHPSVAVAGDALALAYLDERGGVVRAFARRFDAALAPVGSELTLSDVTATSASVPVLAPVAVALADGGFGDSPSAFAALWIETVGGVDRLRLARLEEAGGQLQVAWTRTVADAVAPLREPRLATAGRLGSGERIGVAWIDGATQRLQGSVWSAAGEPVRAAAPIAASDPDAGAEVVFDVDLARAAGADAERVFVVGWVALSSGAWSARFRALDGELRASGQRRDVGADGGTLGSLRLTPLGHGAAPWTNGGAWVAAHGDAKSVELVADVLDEGATPYTLASAAGASLQWVEPAATAAPVGVRVAWIARTVSASRLFVATTQGSPAPPLDLTPAAGSAVGAPTLAGRPGGAVTLVYESDRGGGLDLFAQSVCREQNDP